MSCIFRRMYKPNQKEDPLSWIIYEPKQITAKGLIEANGRSLDDPDENEKEDLQTYMEMMQKYIDDNTERHHMDLITGYSKHMDCDHGDEDSVSGMKAPKKNQKNMGPVKAPSKKK